jgi:Rod binding domain-containing protein
MTAIASSPWSLGSAGGLNTAALKNSSQAKQVEEAARGFETILVRQMLREVRKSSFSEKQDVNNGYMEMVDDQMASMLTQGKGLGFAQKMTEQMLRQSDLAKLINSGKNP